MFKEARKWRREKKEPNGKEEGMGRQEIQEMGRTGMRSSGNGEKRKAEGRE